MSKNRLNTIIICFLSVLAVACGDAGGQPAEGEPGFGEEFAGETDGTGGDPNPEAAEGGDAGNGGDEDPGIDGPFCGDGFVDDVEDCDDGNDEDGDGCSASCEAEAVQGEGEISINLVLDDLGSNEAPLESDCFGVVALVVEDGALVGEGRCFLPANFLDYKIDADVDENGVVEGDIDVVLNGTTHVLDIVGSLDEGALSLEFDGVSLVTSRIRAIWSGTVEADFD